MIYYHTLSLMMYHKNLSLSLSLKNLQNLKGKDTIVED